MSGALLGYLVVNIHEAVATGPDSDKSLWDEDISDAFVKVEIRGGSPSSIERKSTATRPLKNGKVLWNEKLMLAVHEGCEELRLIVCRKKVRDGVEGTSVVAACGLFVKEIIAAVPITKQFELFRPRNAGAGGFVQVAMNFKTPDEVAVPQQAASSKTTATKAVPSGHELRSETYKRQADFDAKKGGNGLVKGLVVASVVGVLAIVLRKK